MKISDIISMTPSRLAALTDEELKAFFSDCLVIPKSDKQAEIEAKAQAKLDKQADRDRRAREKQVEKETKRLAKQILKEVKKTNPAATLEQIIQQLKDQQSPEPVKE